MGVLVASGSVNAICEGDFCEYKLQLEPTSVEDLEVVAESFVSVLDQPVGTCTSDSVYFKAEKRIMKATGTSSSSNVATGCFFFSKKFFKIKARQIESALEPIRTAISRRLNQLRAETFFFFFFNRQKRTKHTHTHRRL